MPKHGSVILYLHGNQKAHKVWGWETSVYSLMRLTWVLQYFSVALADALHILMTQSDVKVTLIGEERPLGGRE